jgi:hypothetical protein
MENQEITFDDIKGLLEPKYCLCYASQGKSLDNCLQEINDAIRSQDMQPLYETVDDWEHNGDEYGEDYALNELRDAIEREFDIEEDEAQELVDQYQDDLLEIIRERDESTYFDDLLRYTDNPVVFYDTGAEIPYGACFAEEDFKDAIKDLRKILGIKRGVTNWDEQIEELIANASYGGMVVIYFRDEVKTLVNTKGVTWIHFKSPQVAIIDMLNGSGHNVEFEKLELVLSFNPKALYVDKLFKYSYVYQVCGMSSSFCDCTEVKYSKSKRKPTYQVPDSKLQDYLSQEARYNKTFKEGKCTRGDMDWNRHRRKQYINEYPCGTHCLDCGNFWVD